LGGYLVPGGGRSRSRKRVAGSSSKRREGVRGSYERCSQERRVSLRDRSRCGSTRPSCGSCCAREEERGQGVFNEGRWVVRFLLTMFRLSVPLGVFVIFAVFQQSCFGQAWTPPRGEGEYALVFQDLYTTKHTLGDGSRLDAGHVTLLGLVNGI